MAPTRSRLLPRPNAASWAALIGGLLLAVAGLDIEAADLAIAGRPVLTSSQQVRRLSPSEAQQGLPVRLQGVITYYDPGFGHLFVQDTEGSVYVIPARTRLDLQLGQAVEVLGVTAVGGLNRIVRDARVTPQGPGTLPAPKQVSLAELWSGQDDCLRVEIEGRVRSAREQNGRLLLELAAAGHLVQVVVLTLPQRGFEAITRAKVRVRGVCATMADRDHRLTEVRLLVPGLDDVIELEPSGSQLYRAPLSSLEAAKQLAGPETVDQPVHVQGVVSAVGPGASMVIKDGNDELRIEALESKPVREGIVVEVEGYPGLRDRVAVLESSNYRRLGFAEAMVIDNTNAASAQSLAGQSVAILRTAEQVRALTPAEAAQGYPVMLRGVVTYYDAEGYVLFFQGTGEGIYVDAGGQPLDLHAGQLVRLRGFSGPGGFAPVIRRPLFTTEGEAPMPPAPRRTLDQVLTGKEDSQWLEIQGTVQELSIEQDRLYLQMASGAGRFRTVVPGFQGKPVPHELLDVQVSLRGVCGSRFNQLRQFLGIQLYVPGLAYIRVVKVPSAEPFAQPSKTIASLLQFRPNEEGNHRLRVEGVVTQVRGSNAFFLQDQTGGLQVRGTELPALQLGEKVAAVGFAKVGDYTPVMERAIIRSLGTAPMPKPVRLSAAAALGASLQEQLHDGTLVQIQGRLVRNRLDDARDLILVIEEGQTIFAAHLAKTEVTAWLRALDPDTELSVTGVCAVQADENRQPHAFRVLLRSATDVQVLASPPWWTPQRTEKLLRATALVALGGLVWLLTLQLRVRRQTEVIRQRLEKEATLERSYAHLVENANDIIYEIDGAGHFTALNHAGERISGYRHEEVIGQHFAKFVTPEDLPMVREKLARKLQGQASPSYEMQILARDGRRVDLEVSTQLVSTGKGRVAVQGIARDITERKQAERQAAAFAGLAHRLSEVTSPQAAAQVMLETADQLLKWDACSLRLFSPLSDSAQVVVNIDTVDGHRTEIPPTDSDRRTTPMMKRVATQGAQLILREEGTPAAGDLVAFGNVTRRSASLLYVPIRHGNAVVGVLTLQSYTAKAYGERDLALLQALADHCGGALERLSIEAARRKSDARKSAILESALDCVISVDAEGHILEFNSATTATFGYSAEYLIGKSIEGTVVPDGAAEPFRAALARCLAGQSSPGSSRPVDLKARRADGTEFPIELSLTRIPSENPVVLTAVIRDLTERLNLETQLRHAQKLESVGQLAAGVAHDFNNILAIILGYAGLLLAQKGHDAESIEQLKEISAAAERAAKLTRQLLAFSRKQVMQPQVLDLSHLVSNVLNMLRRILGEDLSLQFHCAAGLPSILADPGMMEQVLMNLALNARDAMPRGGTLTLDLAAVEVTAEHVRRNPEARVGSFVCLTVSDTGVGMNEQTLSRVFEPFFTTKEVGKGTGLGLATVYGIIKQHQGWLEVASQPHQGTTFKAFLPSRGHAPVEAGDRGSPGPATGQGQAVLLVEDEPALRELSRRMLEQYGYRTFTAANGVEAFAQWSSLRDQITLLVTDLVMPGGLDGAELARRLRVEKPNLRVLFTSGYGRDALRGGAALGPTSRFLAKPYTPTQLALAVQDCIRAQASPPKTPLVVDGSHPGA